MNTNCNHHNHSYPVGCSVTINLFLRHWLDSCLANWQFSLCPGLDDQLLLSSSQPEAKQTAWAMWNLTRVEVLGYLHTRCAVPISAESFWFVSAFCSQQIHTQAGTFSRLLYDSWKNQLKCADRLLHSVLRPPTGVTDFRCPPLFPAQVAEGDIYKPVVPTHYCICSLNGGIYHLFFCPS